MQLYSYESMRFHFGYTLVELMIVISIISILIAVGASSYGRARDRQIGQAAGELLVSTLQQNQQLAKIGNKDCNGKFIGQRITTTQPNILTSTSVCETEDGTPTQTLIPNIDSITSTTIIFNPLSLGITLPSDPFQIDLVSINANTYRVELSKSGTIEYKGLVP